MSSGSSANDLLTGYLAGRITTQELVSAVSGVYYRERGAGSREQLKPLIDIIERVHPGVVELSGNGEKPGFAVRLAERPFPKRYEAEFRQAVEAVLGAAPSSVLRAPGLMTRIIRAIRRVFRASA